MAIHPPEQRNWWKEPVERVELMWVAIAFVWGLVMFAMMPYWHVVGEQNLSNEAYRIDPEVFVKRTEAMAEEYTVREEGETGVPVVRAPAGSDVYLLARQFEWWPILEFEKGRSYRLHISSADVQHGFSLQPVNMNLQIHPGYEMVVTVTPTQTGEFGVVCNEYCGFGHHFMLGKVYVTE